MKAGQTDGEAMQENRIKQKARKRLKAVERQKQKNTIEKYIHEKEKTTDKK